MKKRLFATLLALVMALGLTVTAAADEATDLNELLYAASTTKVEVAFGYDALNNPMTVTVTGHVLNDGSYKLTDDLTINAPLVIQGTVTLDLNGHVLTYGGTAQNSVIVVDDGATFTLTDTGSGGKITGGTGTKYEDEEDSSYSIVFGGGVFVGSKATFNMTGGSIVNCSTTGGTNDKGGGVYLASGYKAKDDTITYTTFNMTGGSIKNCSSGQGGGVCTGAYANITIEKSKIIGCKATEGGGVYCCGDSNLSVEKSTISGCTASGSGGGVYAGANSSLCTFTMENSTITTCKADGNGGGVYHEDGFFTMENGSIISRCTASGENREGNGKGGGGVYLGSEGKLIMKAGSAIFDCTVASGCEGAAVYNWSANVNGQGGSVRGSVYNYGNISNTATDGSTIFYDGITNGDKGTITGKLVRFMRDGSLYAETVANKDGGTISQPTAPTAAEGKVFAGWSYTKNDGSTGTWDFASTFATNAPECSQEKYISKPSITWDVATLTAVWDTQSSSGSGSAHEPIRRQHVTAVEDTTTTDTTTDVVTSAKTFDTGIAVYGAMAVASLLGMGYVGKKRV